MALTNTVNKDSFEPEKELFPTLCRVCMSRNTNLTCVFSADATQTAEKFQFCTGILMLEDDGLPSQLCELCLGTLAIAHKFKTACLRSDEILRNIIKKQNPPELTTIKIELNEEGEAPSSDIGYQEFMAKQEIKTDDDDDDDIYNRDEEVLWPKPKRARAKMKSKKKIDKKEIKTMKTSKAKTVGMRKKKEISDILNSEEDLNPREEKQTKGSEQRNCTLCDTTFDSVKELIQHRKSQHLNCEWICEICGKTFAHRSTHYTHVRSHLPPVFAHQCDQCDYTTWYKADLVKHCRVHMGIKNFICEYCTKSFYNSSNLHEHRRRFHEGGAPVRRHVCPRCGRDFRAADKLRRHLDSHDNVKRLECEVCHARFSRRCQWKIHLTKQHNIIVPRLRPGRPKHNIIIGDKEAAIVRSQWLKQHTVAKENTMDGERVKENP